MTETLALKLVVTPVLIAGASLAGRRWGQAVGGWLVGLPLTSGPVAFFLALEQGAGFVAAVAFGSLAGALAEVAFCLAYGWSARTGWVMALGAASVAFAVTAFGLQRVTIPLLVLAGIVFVALVVALRLMPPRGATTGTAPPPRWDLPARIIVTTVIGLLLGLFSFAGFFVVLGGSIERLGFPVGFAAATAAALAIQAGSLALVVLPARG
jgi:hypothetical protein